jgi:hypothetical protein
MKKMSSRAAIVMAIIILGLGGCATPLRDLRQEAPNQSIEVSGRYDQVAACVMHELQMSPFPNILAMAPPPSAMSWEILNLGDNVTVTGRRGDTYVMIDLIFTRLSDTRTRVESRYGFHPGTYGPQVQDAVGRCAGR